MYQQFITLNDHSSQSSRLGAMPLLKLIEILGTGAAERVTGYPLPYVFCSSLVTTVVMEYEYCSLGPPFVIARATARSSDSDAHLRCSSSTSSSC